MNKNFFLIIFLLTIIVLGYAMVNEMKQLRRAEFYKCYVILPPQMNGIADWQCYKSNESPTAFCIGCQYLGSSFVKPEQYKGYNWSLFNYSLKEAVVQ